jgi:uncharacterized membrane protein YbaN (DUF454 family)
MMKQVTDAKWLRMLMITLGCVCVVLGVIGLFVPMMPGAVFLILAAWFFARSSERFHDWLLTHPRLGPIVLAWHDGRGFERKLRTRILALMWVSMIVSMLILGSIWIALLLVTCGAGTTAFILKQPVYD